MSGARRQWLSPPTAWVAAVRARFAGEVSESARVPIRDWVGPQAGSSSRTHGFDQALVWVVLGLLLLAPVVASAQPCADGDGDGICDVDDPCTNIAAVEASNLRLRIRKILWDPGRQRVRAAAVVDVPTSPPIDPVAKGLRIVVRDDTGDKLDLVIPPGSFDAITDRGWSPSGSGTAWTYRDRAGTASGIMKALVRRRSATSGEIKIVVFGQNGLYPLPLSPPVTASIVIDAPTATTGQCGEGTFDFCFFRNQGAKLLCR